MAIISKIGRFLTKDTSGAVSADWTVLTGAIMLGMTMTLGTFGAGIHVTADAITAKITDTVTVSATISDGTLPGS